MKNDSKKNETFFNNRKITFHEDLKKPKESTTIDNNNKKGFTPL